MNRLPLPAKAAAPTFGGARLRFDKAALLGLASGVALLAVAISVGGSARSFVDLPSLLIVIGGTFAIVTMCYSLGEVEMMLGVVVRTLSHASPDPKGAAILALHLAEDARNNGLLHLDRTLDGGLEPPFLHKALSMVVDGVSEPELESVLSHDIQATPHRLRRSAVMLRRAADYAPAMGLIGTLIGLVQMLGQLSDPQRIGPSMAIALLTTFYGAVLANMVFSPLAVKLDRTAHDEEVVCRVYLMGALSISRQENPRRLELLINSILPPMMRVRYFD
jgi:chemotaxis protein MotA